MRSVSPKSMVFSTIASVRYVRDAIDDEWYRVPSVFGDGNRTTRLTDRRDRSGDPRGPGAARSGPPALLRDDALSPRPRYGPAGWWEADAPAHVRPRVRR